MAAYQGPALSNIWISVPAGATLQCSGDCGNLGSAAVTINSSGTDGVANANLANGTPLNMPLVNGEVYVVSWWCQTGLDNEPPLTGNASLSVEVLNPDGSVNGTPFSVGYPGGSSGQTYQGRVRAQSRRLRSPTCDPECFRKQQDAGSHLRSAIRPTNLPFRGDRPIADQPKTATMTVRTEDRRPDRTDLNADATSEPNFYIRSLIQGQVFQGFTGRTITLGEPRTDERAPT
jgi:hypothetical protein